MYETLVLIRRFEEQAKREADQGRILGTHSAIGEEGTPTGICAHLRDDDYVLGNHRSHHHCIAKGVDINEMMAELLGKATGTNKGKGVQIFIGAKNFLFNHSGLSMVMSPYINNEQKIIGAIGVLGPMRINYARIVPLVDYTSKVIGRILS